MTYSLSFFAFSPKAYFIKASPPQGRKADNLLENQKATPLFTRGAFFSYSVVVFRSFPFLSRTRVFRWKFSA